MAKVRRGVTAHRKHRKILGLVKGHKGGRSKLIRQARESLLHAGQYAFAGRRQRRRDLRKLWITQLGIALRNEGLSYSQFMAKLKEKNILVNRKILAELAVKYPEAFKEIISQTTS